MLALATLMTKGATGRPSTLCTTPVGKSPCAYRTARGSGLLPKYAVAPIPSESTGLMLTELPRAGSRVAGIQKEDVLLVGACTANHAAHSEHTYGRRWEYNLQEWRV